MTVQVAVCGAGAFGRNHIRVYRELAAAGTPVRLAAIVDPAPGCLDTLRAAGIPAVPGDALSPARTNNLPSPDCAPALPDDPQSSHPTPDPSPVPLFPTVEAMLAAVARGDLRIDAASVCAPTSAHHAVSAQLLTSGIHVLVEKPITATLDEADDLIRLAREHRRVLMVGHLERFNPAVQALAPLLRGPMFFEAHRLSVFSPRSLDVDVVLDLMIHDLDIVLTLAASPVAGVHAVGLPILSGKADIANVRVEFTSGCVANFTASRVSTERVRKLRFFQPHQYLSVDYARQDLLVIEVQQPAPAVAPSPALAAAPSPTPSQIPPPVTFPTLGMQKVPVTPGEPLRLEIEAFLHAVQTGTPPPVTAAEARAALALALQIQSAMQTHAQHAGLQAFIGL